ncbi:MAG TPA: hypothetical protein ENO21_02660 [Firmicutes bacterium]|nr:hypothetical protein [Bacillota bacterium]
MDRTSTDCPKCGAELVKRLGTWECTACNFAAESNLQSTESGAAGGRPVSRDPRADRHNLNDLLLGAVSRKDAPARATRRRR